MSSLTFHSISKPFGLGISSVCLKSFYIHYILQYKHVLNDNERLVAEEFKTLIIDFGVTSTCLFSLVDGKIGFH